MQPIRSAEDCHSLLAAVLLQDGNLREEVIDQLLLVTVHPTGEDQKQEMARLQDEVHWRGWMRTLGDT